MTNTAKATSKIISFDTLERKGIFETADGYYIPPRKLVGCVLRYAHNDSTEIRLNHYKIERGELQSLNLFSTRVGNTPEKIQTTIESKLNAHAHEAYSDQVDVTFSAIDQHCAILFAPCGRNDFIGIGTYDTRKVDKRAMELAALMMYIFGYINVSKDAELFNASHDAIYESPTGSNAQMGQLEKIFWTWADECCMQKPPSLN